MLEMMALASPPNGFSLDPAKHEGLPAQDRLSAMPVFTPLRLTVSLDDITKVKSGHRVLSVKGGLHHKFKQPKAVA